MDFSHMIEDLFQTIQSAGPTYALLALFVWVLLEEAGVPLVPTADMVLIFCGYRVSQGDLSALSVVGVTVVATVLGATILYYLSLRGGHPFVFKYGKYLRISQARLDRAERWVQDHRGPTLIAGRMIPGLKTVVSVVAGIFEVDYRSFAAYTTLAATIWALSSVTIGQLFGPEIVRVAGAASHNPTLAGVLIATIAVLAILYVYRRSRRAT